MVAANTTEAVLITNDTVQGEEGTIFNLEIRDNAQSNWFYGISGDGDVETVDSSFRVVDHGGFIEFALPRGTAQFAEMVIHDTEGKLVWRKQAFNKRILRWYKHSAIGAKVPQGNYRFQVRQGDHQVAGIAKIA